MDKKKTSLPRVSRASRGLKTPQFLVEDLVTGLIHGPFQRFKGANQQRLMIQTWFPDLELIVKPILETRRYGACELICESEWWNKRFRKPQADNYQR